MCICGFPSAVVGEVGEGSPLLLSMLCNDQPARFPHTPRPWGQSVYRSQICILPAPLSLQVSVRSRNRQFPYGRYFFLRSHFRKETRLLIFLNVLEWRWWTISLYEFMLTSPIVSLSQFLMTATLLTGLHVSIYVTYWSKLPLHTSS